MIAIGDILVHPASPGHPWELTAIEEDGRAVLTASPVRVRVPYVELAARGWCRDDDCQEPAS